MDNRIPPPRPQVVSAMTTPRPTPTPSRVRFGDVLARSAGTVVQGAEAAMRSLPGSPIMAVALRGGAVPVGMRTRSATAGSAASAEGPGGAGAGGAGMGMASAGGAGLGHALGGGAVGSAGEGNLETSLSQAQEMNLYYLQIQEQVNAQNRTFSALSNVLKAQHDTVKTAIGNIR